MWWRSAGEPEGSGKAWANPGACTYTQRDARAHAQLVKQEAPNHTPPMEMREHTQAQRHTHRRKGLLLLL